MCFLSVVYFLSKSPSLFLATAVQGPEPTPPISQLDAGTAPPQAAQESSAPVVALDLSGLDFELPE
eukprot:m.208689 g.208689  ORF g.208689 m.208689 type:complete len:66 (-) comp53935_c0_seq23:51-248(-)